MAKQSTDGMNQAGGNNAVGRKARPVKDTTSDVPKQRDMTGPKPSK